VKSRLIFQDLESKRLNLVAISEDGLDDMYEYSQKAEFYRYFEYGPHMKIEETGEYLRRLKNLSISGEGHYWFIRLKEEDKIIGTFGVVNIDEDRSSAEIGYGVSPDYWGKGYFSEAMESVLRYLFTDLGFYRIYAKTRPDNLASVRGLEKAGLQQEGILRHFYQSGDGNRYNAALFSILRDEFLHRIGQN